MNQFSAGPHSGWAEESANRKSERVQESRDRESAEGSENSVRIVAPAGDSEFWGV